MRLFSWIAAFASQAFLILVLLIFDHLFLQSPFLLIPFIAVEVYFLYGIFRRQKVRIEISENGILYDSGRYIINTSWDNVERIGKKVPNVSLNIPVEGLVLRDPSANKRLLIAGLFWSNAMGIYEADYSRSIPLQGLWSWNWRKSELAQDLEQHLPHLLKTP